MAIGEIIGAAGSILGGLFGGKSEKKIAADNRAFQLDINRENLAAQNMINQQNIAEAQRAEAFNAAQEATRVQRVVADAKAAGIHPLAALGASGLSASSAVSPVLGAAVADASGGIRSPGSGSSMGDAIGQAFAQIGAALDLKTKAAMASSATSVAKKNRIEVNALEQATSRTLLSKARSAGQGGQGSVANLNIGGIAPFKTTRIGSGAKEISQAAGGRYGDDAADDIGRLNLIEDVIRGGIHTLLTKSFVSGSGRSGSGQKRLFPSGPGRSPSGPRSGYRSRGANSGMFLKK